MTFHVGQKVVCVDDDPDTFEPNGLSAKVWGLASGGVYTVRAIYVCPEDGDVCILLNEIRRERYVRFRALEVGFRACRFRPVQEQGMSMLRAILANPKQKVDA